MERQETLAQLYALRAGLSVISIEKDKVTSIFNEYEQKSDQYDRLVSIGKQEVEIKEEELKRRQSEYDKSKAFMSETGSDELNEYVREVHQRRSATIFWSMLSIICWTGAIVLFIFGALSLFTDIVDNIAPYLDDIGLFLGVPLAIGLIILFFTVIKEKVASNSAAYKSALKKLDETYRKYSIEEKQKRLDNATRAYELAKSEKQSRVHAAIESNNSAGKELDEYMGFALQTAAQSREMCEQIYSELTTAYGEILDERDWQYVDMYIYLYETDRADSKKEALQLIDRYEHDKILTETIEKAGREVRISIENGLSRLQSSMENCFRGLSEQLNIMHSETMLKMDRMVGQLDNMNYGLGIMSSHIEDIKDEVNFNSALQIKANMTSEQLMKDVSYMRLLDEQAEIRRRNGA